MGAAENNLDYGEPYAFTPATGNRSRDLREGTFSQADFLARAEAFLDTLRTRFPDFVFSNKLICTENEFTMKNDLGLELFDADRVFSFSLIVPR
jgi:hypothetical protein